MPVRIGELLLKEKRITAEQLQDALTYQRQNGGKLGANLVKLGYIQDDEITALLSKQYGVPSISLAQFEIDPAVIKLVPAETARKYQIVPLSRSGATLTIAMTDPTNVFAMDDVKFMTGYNVEPVVASETGVSESIEKYYGAAPTTPTPPRGSAGAAMQALSTESALEMAAKALEEMPTEIGDVEVMEDLEEISAEALTRQGEDAPVVKLVNVILLTAIKKGASDIHIEPYEKQMPRALPHRRRAARRDDTRRSSCKNAIASRLKIMAQLDIAERRLPQDGRIKLKLGDRAREMDFRVSRPADAVRREDRHAPARQGQPAARHDEARLRAEALAGLQVGDPPAVRHGAGHRPDRLAARPPRSTRRSRSSTRPSTNISTAEDPVEYNLHGINQVQMHEDIGLNFAAALRSFLRQDPDIIMVGEIRDFETAEIAVKAALTGHLVLSTLHTNDAPSTDLAPAQHGRRAVPRHGSLNLVLASASRARPVPRLQGRRRPSSRRRSREVGFTEEQIRTRKLLRGTGCDTCNGTGYKGRVALYEVMDFATSSASWSWTVPPRSSCGGRRSRNGMITLRGSGLRKIMDGVTTVEEVLRETSPLKD